MRHLVFFAVLLAACAGEQAVNTDDTSTPDDTAADTGPVDTSWEPAAFNIAAGFAVNDAGQLSGWSLSTGESEVPWLEIYMWEDSDTAPDPDDLRDCSVLFILDDPSGVSLEQWSFTDDTNDESMLHTGWTVPDDARVVRSDCPGWATDRIGTPEDLVSAVPWGVGVGNLRADVIEAVETTYADTFLNDAHTAGELLGASWYSTVWEPNRWASHTAWATPTSGGQIEVDEQGVPTAYMSAEAVNGVAGLPEGFYRVVSISGWSAEAYLLE